MLLNIWVFDKGGYSYEFFVCVSNWEMFFSDAGCSANVYDWVFLIGCRNESRRTRGSAADSQSQSPYRERVQLYVPCE